jgi:biopolymer transport protein ExbD
MRGYQKKKRVQGEVELNLAAMLDMAFQLLAFFILTFRPSPVETQISLRMPPAKGDGPSATLAPLENIKEKPEEQMQQIPVIVHGTPDGGEIARIDIGGRSIQGQSGDGLRQVLGTLNGTLAEMLSQTDFGGVEMRVSQNLLYERLMQVVDICTQQHLKNGNQLTQVSISEIGAGQ